MRAYPFWQTGRGSSDAVFWVPIYGGHAKDKWWFKAIIKPLYRLGTRAHRARYWLLYRFDPKHQYHLVNTGLEPGYYDVDTLMLNACFALLKRYIEREMGGIERIEKFNTELRDPGKDVNAPMELKTGQADRQASAVDLYRWWTVTRPADRKRSEELLDYCYGGRHGTYELPPEKQHEVMGVKVARPWWRLGPLPADWEQKRKEFHALEAKIARDEQSMLHRLITIRGSLWT